MTKNIVSEDVRIKEEFLSAFCKLEKAVSNARASMLGDGISLPYLTDTERKEARKLVDEMIQKFKAQREDKLREEVKSFIKTCELTILKSD